MGKWINVKELAERLSISVRQAWRLVAEHVLPQPAYISRRCPRWREDEVEEAMERVREKTKEGS